MHLGAFAVGVDDNGVFVHLFDEPVRQPFLQSSVEFNLKSEVKVGILQFSDYL